MVTSHLRLRRSLGWLGAALPVAIVAACTIDAAMAGAPLGRAAIPPSISAAYHGPARDAVVGILVTIGLFLTCYRGHPRAPGDRISDDALASVAGVSAVLVAVFPVSRGGDGTAFAQTVVGAPASNLIHGAAAIAFFGALAAFCLTRFSRTRSAARARLFRACGYVILGSIAVVVVSTLLSTYGPPALEDAIEGSDAVFWVEALGVWAFALSWLAKGRAIEAIADAL
ncbi:MAG: hypothetical protein ACU0BF_04710 [Paracoccaceae bacterium]